MAGPTYDVIRDFFKPPLGQTIGVVSRVATDSRDRVYVLQRKDPPVLVYERDGTFIGSWGTGEIADPHGLKITGDVVYTADRTGSVAKSFTLEGKLLLELGQRGVYSDTGCTGAPWLAARAAGPFNHPTEMNAHPNGDIYVTDGYRNARVHRFSAGGTLKTSWGAPGAGPGEFHLPHCVVFDESGRLYVADRANRRIQIFSPDGVFLDQWTVTDEEAYTSAFDGTSLFRCSPLSISQCHSRAWASVRYRMCLHRL